jgi:hypothetical protein
MHPGIIDTHWNNDAAFVGMCGSGTRDGVLWLVTAIHPDVHGPAGDKAFLSACECGNADAVRTLMMDFGIGIDPQTIATGIRACLEFAVSYTHAPSRVACLELLWASHGGLDVHEDQDWMFKTATDSGFADVLAWVVSKGETDTAWPQKTGSCELRWV